MPIRYIPDRTSQDIRQLRANLNRLNKWGWIQFVVGIVIGWILGLIPSLF